MQTAFTAEELSKMEVPSLPKSRRGITKKATVEGWSFRETPTPGGGPAQRHYPISALPEEAQLHLLKCQVPTKREAVKGVKERMEEAEAKALAQAPAWARKQALRRRALLDFCEGKKGTTLRAALEAYTQEHGEAVSLSTYYNWRKALEETGTPGLLPAWGNREGETTVPDDLYRLFAGLRLREGAPEYSICYRFMLEIAQSRGLALPDPLPTVKAFVRRLDKEVPKAVQELRRLGKRKGLERMAPSIQRDPDSIQAGEVWVSDHRLLDVMAEGANGRGIRAWLTAWMDMRTSRFIGWVIRTEAPNTDRVFYSFYRAVKAAGGILPKAVYLDNGKDYRSKDFAGGPSRNQWLSEDEQVETTGLMAVLGVEAMFALPYNARAKTIERRFAELGRIEPMLPGYTGRNALVKPESLKGDVKEKRILKMEDILKYVDASIRRLNELKSDGAYLLGMTPNEAWNEMLPEAEELRSLPHHLSWMLMQRTRVVKMGRHGLPVRKGKETVWYYDEWMATYMGEELVLRYDPEEPELGYVCRPTGELLGEAWADALLASARARTDQDRTRLRSVLTLQKSAKKALLAAEAALPQSPEEISVARLRDGEDGGVATGMALPGPDVKSTPITPIGHDLPAQIEAKRREGTYNLYAEPMPKKKKLRIWASDPIED
jgi:putative transposase